MFIVEALLKLLNEKQRAILKELNGKTASSFVREFSRKHGIARSTVWLNLRKLRDLGLIDFGEGKPVRVNSELLKEVIEDER